MRTSLALFCWTVAATAVFAGAKVTSQTDARDRPYAQASRRIMSDKLVHQEYQFYADWFWGLAERIRRDRDSGRLNESLLPYYRARVEWLMHLHDLLADMADQQAVRDALTHETNTRTADAEARAKAAATALQNLHRQFQTGFRECPSGYGLAGPPRARQPDEAAARGNVARDFAGGITSEPLFRRAGRLIAQRRLRVAQYDVLVGCYGALARQALGKSRKAGSAKSAAYYRARAAWLRDMRGLVQRMRDEQSHIEGLAEADYIRPDQDAAVARREEEIKKLQAQFAAKVGMPPAKP